MVLTEFGAAYLPAALRYDYCRNVCFATTHIPGQRTYTFLTSFLGHLSYQIDLSRFIHWDDQNLATFNGR